MADMAQVAMGQSCIPHTFTFPALFGAKLLNLNAKLVTNYSMEIPMGMYASHHAMSVSNLNYCNVFVEYTHPGYNDSVNLEAWLPVDNWNGRLQATGGGGLQAGLIPQALAGAVSEGYAAVSTDGGHALDPFDPSSWALTSPGNLNWLLLQDFSSTTLNDLAVIGKHITTEFYGSGPRKSYWNGCSMGGRQGLQLAQSYPTAFDGILAAAPAIKAPQFIMAEFWPQMMMHEAGEYPPPCEFDAITEAAVEACDELDGVKDGIVAAPELCKFDAKPLIGKEIDCEATGKKTKISQLAVKVAESAWEGARRPDGSFLWHGIHHQAPLTGMIGLANTVCSEGSCQPAPFPIPESWLKWFVLKDPDADVRTLKHDEVSKLFHQSELQFKSIIGAEDPDLTEFNRAGGKMITWHGHADQVIMPDGMKTYYEAVMNHDSQTHDYYRFFEAPGAYHCFYGPGPYPGAALDKLVEWVEDGKAPDVIPATSLPDAEGRIIERNLCAYPKKVQFKGTGDIRKAESFECV